MSFDAERLYALLPAVYRVNDAAQGGRLKALLSVIAEQVAVLDENLTQLYDDQFIETCAEWVVPYIGDVIGVRSLHGVGDRSESGRAQVANTLASRRRKGTAAVIEQLARDVTGRNAKVAWHANVVEFFPLLATTQSIKNHRRLDNRALISVRQPHRLERIGTSFDPLPHTAEVGRIAVNQGRYNIPNIGIFMWRLAAYPLVAATPWRVGPRRYTVSPFGSPVQLYSKPEPEAHITQLAAPINVPMPITRRAMAHQPELYYGAARSVSLSAGGVEIPASRIIVADLSDAASDTWSYTSPDRYLLDPVLGRVATPADEDDPADLRVTYHYGFSADVGGGAYDRSATVERPASISLPDDQATIPDALANRPGEVVEITDNGLYVWDGSPLLTAAAGESLELRSADERRAAIRLGAELVITGGEDAEVVLSGLMIGGAPLRVPDSDDNRLAVLRLLDCTLVPGISLNSDGTPASPDTPSLIVESPRVRVEIERCILGPLRVAAGAQVSIVESILDATAVERTSYSAPQDTQQVGGTLTLDRCTVIGQVYTERLELVSNSIILAGQALGQESFAVFSAQRQRGCVRFSYLPFDSYVPRRYYCQPTSADAEATARPQFTSLRYGDAAYGQLARTCPRVVSEGADDEAEMGVFHDLRQPQRATNLRVSLDEYLRFGLEAGIFYAS